MAFTPEEVFKLHKEYADEFTQLAASGLNSAFAALSNSGLYDYRPAQIGWVFPDFGTPNTDIELPDPPKDPKYEKMGKLEAYRPIPNMVGSTVPPALPPELSQLPKYIAPPKPAGSVPAFNEKPPGPFEDPVIPPAPNYIPMLPPTLPYPGVDIPDPPEDMEIPDFEGEKPSPIVVPDPQTLVNVYLQELANARATIPAYAMNSAAAIIARFCPDYAALTTRINSIILSYTDPDTGGGAGIPAHLEVAIYSRATDRSAQEVVTVVETAAKAMGKRGFTLPPLALQAATKDALVKMGDANVKASTDIAINNLKLEQEHFQMMVKLGEQLEEKMFDMAMGELKLGLEFEAQAIASAKAVLDAYLGAYNLQVLVYKALWDGYAADAAVYNARIAGITARVALYEAEIRAEMAKVEIDKAYVSMMESIVAMNSAMANMYKVQVDAAMAGLEVAKLETQIYESQVRAFAASISAYEAQWSAYKAQVDGELAPFKAYSDLASAYTAQVAGFKAGIEAYEAQIRGISSANVAIGSVNDATLKVYATQAETAIKVFEREIASYSAQSSVAVQQSNIELEYWRTTSNLLFQEFSVSMNHTFEYAREQMNLFQGQMNAAITAANGLAQASQVAGNLAGSAMQGLTSVAGNINMTEGGGDEG
jgi:hypothetical protein